MSALRFAVVATLALFAVCALAQAKDFVSCGADTDDFQISELNVSPDPPVMGQNVTVSAAGTLKTDITGGSVTLEVYLHTFVGKIRVVNKKENICQSVGSIPNPCPIKAGPYSKTITEMVPHEKIPSGTYSGQVRGDDQDGKQIACIAFEYKQ